MTFNQGSIDQAIAVLKQQFGDRLSVAQTVREQHGHTTTRMPNQPPDAVVFPKSAEEISSIMQTCHKLGCPVIAFGAGSSLEGHVNAPYGGISIDMNQLDQVLAVNNEDLDVVVQPGITREALNDYLRDSGLFSRLTRARMPVLAAWRQRVLRERMRFVMAPCATISWGCRW